MPRPIVPAPTTAMVFTSIRDSLSSADHCLRFGAQGEDAVSRFIESDDDARAMREKRPPNQIGRLRHQLDGVGSRRRLLRHVALAIKFVARTQEFLVIALADQLIEFGFREGLLVEVARVEVELELEQETSCFSACGSSGLLVERELGCHAI